MASPITHPSGARFSSVQCSYDGEGGRWKKTKLGGKTAYYIGSHYAVKSGVTTLCVFAGSTWMGKITGVDKHNYFHKGHMGGSNKIRSEAGLAVKVAE